MSSHTNFRGSDRSDGLSDSGGNWGSTSGWSQAAADAYSPKGRQQSDNHSGAIEAFGELFSFAQNSGAHDNKIDPKVGAKGEQDLSAIVFSPEGQKMLYSSNNSQGAKAADAIIQRVLDS